MTTSNLIKQPSYPFPPNTHVHIKKLAFCTPQSIVKINLYILQVFIPCHIPLSPQNPKMVYIHHFSSHVFVAKSSQQNARESSISKFRWMWHKIFSSIPDLMLKPQWWVHPLIHFYNFMFARLLWMGFGDGQPLVSDEVNSNQLLLLLYYYSCVAFHLLFLSCCHVVVV
jgi:hypothetical protein